MNPRTFARVPHAHVEDWKREGWVVSDSAPVPHHDFYTRMMEWKGDGEPKMPEVAA